MADIVHTLNEIDARLSSSQKNIWSKKVRKVENYGRRSPK